VDLAELLAGRREGFVLKPAVGARGEGVHVGKFTPPARWAEALAEALAAGDWIAQEYVEPLSVEYQIGAEGCTPHEVIWGIFVLGETLGGGFLRMMPRGAGDGVINSARGATEGPIFEVRERPAG
jgi:glutathione synthase/RimK-type ligase-like ATP-grasp enzyme